jgi:hypothetical protein
MVFAWTSIGVGSPVTHDIMHELQTNADLAYDNLCVTHYLIDCTTEHTTDNPAHDIDHHGPFHGADNSPQHITDLSGANPANKADHHVPDCPSDYLHHHDTNYGENFNPHYDTNHTSEYTDHCNPFHSADHATDHTSYYNPYNSGYYEEYLTADGGCSLVYSTHA